MTPFLRSVDQIDYVIFRYRLKIYMWQRSQFRPKRLYKSTKALLKISECQLPPRGVTTRVWHHTMSGKRTVGLVGCVATKLGKPSMSKDLYILTLFRGGRRYVDKLCDEWFVLSALHELVDPEGVIEPYDVTLENFLLFAKAPVEFEDIGQIESSLQWLSKIWCLRCTLAPITKISA